MKFDDSYKERVFEMSLPLGAEINKGDFGMMCVSALRYAQGRMTYIVGSTIDFVEKYITYLPMNSLLTMRRDINEMKGRDFGMPVDRDCWVAFKSKVDAEIKRRENSTDNRT